MKNSSRGNRGFSLIELAIVMVIIGILIVPLLTLSQSILEKRYSGTTNANLFIVRQALAQFFLVNNRYPCPGAAINIDSAYNFDEDCEISNPSDIARARARGVRPTIAFPSWRPARLFKAAPFSG